MTRSKNNILLPENYGRRFEYKYPREGGGNSSNKYPTRVNRVRHAQTVLEKLNNIKSEVEEIRNESDEPVEGFYIEFKGEPKDLDEDKDFKLKVEGLDRARSYEVVSYKKNEDGSEKVVVFVPEGKLDNLERKFSSAAKEEGPRNVTLVNSIADLKLAILQSLWTSPDELYPDNDVEFLWEVWTFRGDSFERKLELFCDNFNATLLPHKTDFLDRTVRLVRTTARNLSNILHHQKIITEIRKPADTPLPIVDGNIEEQIEWADDFSERVDISSNNIEVWLLDSGINRENPILINHIDENKIETVDADWGGADDYNRWKNHGTRMAGIILFGDLLKFILQEGAVSINHGLGSVKILPPNGHNDSQLYPSIMESAVSRSSISNPYSRKVFCLAVTDSVTSKAGESTSWSAKIDELSCSTEEKKLFIIAIGNSSRKQPNNYPFNYPEENETASIQDPAQSWNALSVGAYTNLQQIDEDELQNGYFPLARRGELAPESTTSLTWVSLSTVPLKPDVVFEGGNVAMENNRQDYDEPPSLKLLTTSGRLRTEVFSTLKDTSSASALAANFAAILMNKYEDYWPETVRGLMVHSAEWTELMYRQFYPYTNKNIKVQSLLRVYGFGVPNLDRALACAENEVTLIAQKELKPYHKPEDRVVYCDCHIYDLPWPREVLQSLGQENVKMRVTLSYFIEPNPSRRGNIKKYEYASYGLRFTMISPTESEESFRQRVSKIFQNNEDVTRENEDNHNWFLGPNLRTRGSIHSDIWEGQAADLASKAKLAIFPVGGWWKEYKSQQRWEQAMRYSLVVSIETQSEEAEIYNQVINNIEVPVEVDL